MLTRILGNGGRQGPWFPQDCSQEDGGRGVPGDLNSTHQSEASVIDPTEHEVYAKLGVSMCKASTGSSSPWPKVQMRGWGALVQMSVSAPCGRSCGELLTSLCVHIALSPCWPRLQGAEQWSWLFQAQGGVLRPARSTVGDGGEVGLFGDVVNTIAGVVRPRDSLPRPAPLFLSLVVAMPGAAVFPA